MKAIILILAMSCIAPSKLESRADCQTVERARPFIKTFTAAAERFDLPLHILVGVAAVESNMRAQANSGKGDLGLMQVRCRAWKNEKLHPVADFEKCEELYKPSKAIFTGAEILDLQYSGSRSTKRDHLHALTSYKAGHLWKKRGIPVQSRYYRLIDRIGRWILEEISLTQRTELERAYIEWPFWLATPVEIRL